MKKFFNILVILAIFMTTSIASAAFEETVEEDADLLSVKKMAIAYPNYYKTEEAEPELVDFIREVYNAGRFTSSREIISYADVVSAIRRDTGIDIYSLSVEEAEKVFHNNVKRYADTYVVVTVTNNSKRPWLFFYVYNSNDGKLMYTYSVESSLIGKTAKDYGIAAEGFFKHFDKITKKNMSKEERKELEEKQKAARDNKRKVEKYIYKTGKSKIDMVRVK